MALIQHSSTVISAVLLSQDRIALEKHHSCFCSYLGACTAFLFYQYCCSVFTLLKRKCFRIFRNLLFRLHFFFVNILFVESPSGTKVFMMNFGIHCIQLYMSICFYNLPDICVSVNRFVIISNSLRFFLVDY